MTYSKGTGTVPVLGFPVCTLGFSLSPKIILDIASQTWCHYLKRINKSGLKSVGPTSVCPVMVPGLLYSMAALDSASLGMGGWAPLAAIFFPPALSESFDKEGHGSLLIFLILHSVLMQGFVGLWRNTCGSSNFTEATALKFIEMVFFSECIK